MSSNVGTNLKISAIVVVFMVSVLGTFIPMMLSIKYSLKELLDSSIFMTLKCIATGVIIGVATMHLLPESIEVLEEIQTTYPLAMAIMVFGIFFALGVDQMALYFIHNIDENKSISDDGSKTVHGNKKTSFDKHVANNEPPIKDVVLEMSTKSNQSSSLGSALATHNTQKDKDEENPCHLDVLHDKYDDMDYEKKTSKLVIRAYILEVAMAVHSIIIGFNFGSSETNNKQDLISLKILYIAFVFHQLFEGIGLGTTLVEAFKQNKENFWCFFNKVYLLILLFALSFSSGILIGLLTSSTSKFSLLIIAYMNAFTAGILLHSSLIEMLSNDFMNPLFEKRPYTKVNMFCGLFFGYSVMALLAVWG